MKIVIECASVEELEQLRLYLSGGRATEPGATAAGSVRKAEDVSVPVEQLMDEYLNFPDERKSREGVTDGD